MKQFAYNADEASVAALAGRYPDLATQKHRKPVRGLFSLYFNNKRRQITGYQSYDCEGTLYSDGAVHLNTLAFPIREFATMTEMLDAIGEYGDCAVTWLDEVKQ